MSTFLYKSNFSAKKLFILMAVTLMLATGIVTSESTPSFALTGAGTIGDPYLVNTCDDVTYINIVGGSAYRLTADLDCTSKGNNVMIANIEYDFFGDFDGANHTITVDINKNETEVGLFRVTLAGAKIHDLTVGGSVIGEGNTGAVVGSMTEGTLENVHSTAVVNGGNGTGGVLGRADSTTITNSTSSGSVSGTGYVGGLIGATNGVTEVDTSHSSSNVTSSGDYAGGLVGLGDGGIYSDSYATGNVTISDSNSESAGGFIGNGCAATYTNTYATGNVEGFSRVGGFAGSDYGECFGGDYEQSYATGDATGTAGVGGFIGSASYSILHQTFASGEVLGTQNVGGLIGVGTGNYGGHGSVSESFSTGNVTGDAQIGGLIGQSDGIIVTDSYSRSQVVGGNAVAGFIGSVSDEGSEIASSYSAGTISHDDEEYGGLVATQTDYEGSTNSFWDAELSGLNTSEIGVGKNTSAMKTKATFTSELFDDSWDFDEVWGMNSEVNDGYPCLQWASEFCGTSSPEVTDDGDGVLDAIENGAPNNGDANGDGTPDSKQANVASFVSPITGKYVAIVVPDTCTLTSTNVESEASKGVSDGTFKYPNGLLGFTSSCGTPGVTISVQQYFFNAGSASGFVARKYTAYNKTFQTLNGASVTDVNVGGMPAVKLVYSLTDGGKYDNDQLANGIIVDPAGLGIKSTSAAGTLANTGSSLIAVQIALSLLMLGFVLAVFCRRKIYLYIK